MKRVAPGPSSEGSVPERVRVPGPRTGAPSSGRIFEAEPGRGAGSRPSVWRLLRQRRHFLVHRREQLRTAWLATAVALVLVGLLNFALYSARSQHTGSLVVDAPQLAPMLRSQDRSELWLVALASFVFVGGVFAVTILETHRTAGASINLGRRLRDVQAGHYDARLHLRQGDSLRSLEEPFNEMGRALQERAWAEADRLETLATQAERLATPAEALELARELREMADVQRGLAG